MKIIAEMEVSELKQESNYGNVSGHVGCSTEIELEADGQFLEKPTGIGTKETTGYVGLYGLPTITEGWKLGDKVRVTVERI